MCSLLCQSLNINSKQDGHSSRPPRTSFYLDLNWFFRSRTCDGIQGHVSLGEMCEGVRDTGKIREGGGKEVGSIGVEPQSDLAEDGALEFGSH